MKLHNIFLAHCKTGLPIILHGSSGFGKSSAIYEFGRTVGFRIVEKRTCHVDPVEIMLPSRNEEEKVVEFWPARWLHELTNPDCPPTILFFDEFNRPSSQQTFSLFTELFLNRSIDGIKLSDNVYLFGAVNLSSEDTGVMEIPNAVMNRATHIIWAPDQIDIITNMQSKTAQAALKMNSKIVKTPTIPDLVLDNCPRQIDATCFLWETGLLNEEELSIVAQGRVGKEAGALLAGILIKLKRDEEFRLPQALTETNFEQVSAAEQEGMMIEVCNLLKDVLSKPEGNPMYRLVADYLLQYATPETCRSLQTSGFHYTYPAKEYPLDKAGKPFLDLKEGGNYKKPIYEANMPWQFYAIHINKLVPKVSR